MSTYRIHNIDPMNYKKHNYITYHLYIIPPIIPNTYQILFF